MIEDKDNILHNFIPLISGQILFLLCRGIPLFSSFFRENILLSKINPLNTNILLNTYFST